MKKTRPWHGALPGAGCAGHAVWSAGADPGAQPGATRPLPPKCSGCAICRTRAARATVLAAQEDGFIMRHLGRPAEQTPSLGNEIGPPCPQAPKAVLRLWLQRAACH